MTEQQWLRIFSRNLVAVMRERGISQADLAEETNLSQSTISKYMNGIRMPKVTAVVNISHVLDCDVSDLIDFDETIL